MITNRVDDPLHAPSSIDFNWTCVWTRIAQCVADQVFEDLDEQRLGNSYRGQRCNVNLKACFLDLTSEFYKNEVENIICIDGLIRWLNVSYRCQVQQICDNQTHLFALLFYSV